MIAALAEQEADLLTSPAETAQAAVLMVLEVTRKEAVRQAGVAATLQIATKEQERHAVPDEVIDASLLAKPRSAGKAADVGKPRVSGKLDHHQAAAPLAKPRARRLDEIHGKAATARARVDCDEMNTSCPTRSRGFAEHNESDRHTRTASDDPLILIARSCERMFERCEHRSGVGRLGEHRADEGSGSGGIRVGERAERGRH
jgi:hypothetical protein